MHIAVAPIDLQRGERLWTFHEELLERFHLDTVPRPEWCDPPVVVAP
jgi:hypothetical protein